MRTAIISDIHGNLEAFTTVLRDIGQAGVDTVINLGDIVGYGPDPEECLQLVAAEKIPSVMGNHEYAIITPHYVDQMNSETRKSLEITIKMLSATSRDYMGLLPSSMLLPGSRFVHGCPPDSITTYLYEPDDTTLLEIFAAFPEKISFFGHTHVLSMFSYAGNGREERAPLTPGLTQLDEGRRYLINVGSVGQPRDRLNNKAKYVIWDQDSHSLEVRQVAYDIASTAEKIISRGLPANNARRLW